MARVLVVDDSPTDTKQLKHFLEKAGFEILVATSGEQAIDMAREQQPDCIVMDVVMPGVNGFQATRTLSKDSQTSGIPIVVVSAKNQATDRLWAMRQGAKEYIVKPVKQTDLVNKVRAACGL